MFTARYEINLYIPARNGKTTLFLDYTRCIRIFNSLTYFTMSNGLSEFSSEISHVAFFAKTQPSKRDNNFIITLPFKHKTQPKCSNSFLCCVLPTVHFPTGNFLHILNIYLVSSLHLPEGQAGTDRNLQNSQRF